MRAVNFLLVTMVTFAPLFAANLPEIKPNAINLVHLSINAIMIKPNWYIAEASKSRGFKFSYDGKEHSCSVEMRLRYNDSPFLGEKEPLLGEVTITLDGDHDYEIYAIEPKLQFLQAHERDFSKEELHDRDARVRFILSDRKMLTFYAFGSLEHRGLIQISHYLRFSASIFLLKRGYEFPKTENSQKPTLLKMAAKHLPWKSNAYIKSVHALNDVSVKDFVNMPSIDIYESWDEDSDRFPLTPKYSYRY